MKTKHSLHLAGVVCTCIALVLPQIALAADPSALLQLPVSKTRQDVALSTDGLLNGAIVDANGNPIPDSPIVIGQRGKVLAKVRTGKDGRFTVNGLRSGQYQMVSYAGVYNYQVWEGTHAPETAKMGVIHVANPSVARGAEDGLLVKVVKHPAVLASIVAGSIVIPITVDGEDAS